MYNHDSDYRKHHLTSQTAFYSTKIIHTEWKAVKNNKKCDGKSVYARQHSGEHNSARL